MKKILNLTQHKATPEQIEAGVFDLEGEKLQRLKELLTFTMKPIPSEIKERAVAIAELAVAQKGEDWKGFEVMIGGALWLMKPLIEELIRRGLVPLFAYTEREVVEEKQPDGSIKKTAIFRHEGFVRAWF